jgi:hypothetical protein
MKIETLLYKLEDVRVKAETDEFDTFADKNAFIAKVILQLLLEYLNNPRIEEAVNDISF